MEAVRGKKNLNGLYLIYSGYKADNIFYLNILKDKGIDISLKDREKLKIGDKVIVCQKKVEQYIDKHYGYEVLNINGNVKTYRIYEKKQ